MTDTSIWTESQIAFETATKFAPCFLYLSLAWVHEFLPGEKWDENFSSPSIPFSVRIKKMKVSRSFFVASKLHGIVYQWRYLKNKRMHGTFVPSGKRQTAGSRKGWREKWFACSILSPINGQGVFVEKTWVLALHLSSLSQITQANTSSTNVHKQKNLRRKIH